MAHSDVFSGRLQQATDNSTYVRAISNDLNASQSLTWLVVGQTMDIYTRTLSLASHHARAEDSKVHCGGYTLHLWCTATPTFLIFCIAYVQFFEGLKFHE